MDSKRFRHRRGMGGAGGWEQPSVMRRTGFPGRPRSAVRGGRSSKSLFGHK